MSGLFVQKHVEAIRSQGVDVRVIFSQGWHDMWRQWRTLRRGGWMPDVVQLNVIQKQGLLALWLKARFGTPYIIIEHWSGYLPENGQFMRMSRLKQNFYRYIAQQSSMLLCVSERHSAAMKACGVRNAHMRIIHNVVDDFFFEPSAVRSQKSEQKTLLHVSCFDEHAKNVKGLLRAAKRLSEKRLDWRLVLVGTGVNYLDVIAYAKTLDLPQGLLVWKGELTPRQVAEQFDQANLFVLSSHYENAPVVLSESLAKGVPIVSTNVGGIPEMVNDQCGILVPPGDDEALANAIERMLDHMNSYKRDTIRKYGKLYSFAQVGSKLKTIYEQVS